VTEPVFLENIGPVLRITLNAPKRRNALTPEMLCLLADAFISFAQDTSLRVAVITGAGAQAFCAGGDLARTLPLLTGDRLPEDDWDRRLLADPQVLAASGLRDFPLDKPVVAAINGHCMAAGFELMLGTDVRIASNAARFGLPEVQRALLPFAGSMARLSRQIPHAIAMSLLLTGDSIDAAEAFRIGLVNEIHPQDQVISRAMAVAEKIARNGPLAVRAIKRTVVASSGLPLEQAYIHENAAWHEVRASADAREGPRAFVEKRPPRHEGR
jgi:enoyl-CoA hydratase